MKVYIPYFLLLFIFWFFVPDYKIVDNKQKNRRQIFNTDLLVFCFILTIMCVFSGFRRIVASAIDEYAYRNRWDYYSQISLSYLIHENPQEIIFKIYYWLSTRLFSNNQGGILLTSIFITSSGIYILWKDSTDFKYGLLLVLASGWFWDTFNGIQQSTAAAMFFLCFRFAITQKLYQYYIGALICFLIHQASLFILPMYYLANFVIDRKKILIIVGLTSLILFILYREIPLLSNYLMTLEQYSDITYKERHGVNIITRMIAVVPASVAFYIFPQIDISDKLTRFCGSMTAVHAGIMLAAFIDTYIARFALFTSFFVILFFSRIGRYFINKNTYNIFKYTSVILYGIVTFLRIYKSYYYFSFAL